LIGAVTPVLEIHELRKAFGSGVALDGVSFSLQRAERLAFLGPNGAGKTTLIRCLSGRVRPDGGSIRMSGGPIAARGARDAIGLVPQEIAIYPDLTTRENLVAFGRFCGLKAAALRERVDWALRWTGLESRATDLVGTFSGGMKRRVNLACGVLHAPKVLLLDEPTVGVDPQSREKIYAMLDDLSGSGTSILLTTHHLDEAQSQSDRIVIIDRGRVVADGAFDTLVHDTVGADRVVRLRLDRPIADSSLARAIGSLQDARQPPLEQIGDSVLAARVTNVARELPRMIDSLRDHGYGIADIDVQAPSLHHVFLHLTGRQLRD